MDRLSGLAGRLSGLRPPDVWNTPAPTLREEVARVMEGSHLPDQAWLRRAETARAVVSAGISAVLLLLVHINRSAARQGVALLVLAVLVAVAAIWTR
ncbi:hypothetical protein ACQEU5_07125 [Marinactinospora thermotolerans]|uniref:hypothetical protein n=1 Tax=Marinactinospora thermotolerans TaxID=531310 RepID=UPI003D93CA7D